MATQKIFKFKNAYTAEALVNILNSQNLSYGKVKITTKSIGGVPVIYFPAVSASCTDRASIMPYGAKKNKDGTWAECSQWAFTKGGYIVSGGDLAKANVKSGVLNAIGLGSIFYLFDPDRKKQNQLFTQTIAEIERLGL